MSKSKRKGKEIAVISLVRLNPTIQFVTDGAVEKLAQKKRATPSFGGGPKAVLNVKDRSKVVAFKR